MKNRSIASWEHYQRARRAAEFARGRLLAGFFSQAGKYLSANVCPRVKRLGLGLCTHCC
jgi:hypothetical protein